MRQQMICLSCGEFARLQRHRAHNCQGTSQRAPKRGAILGPWPVSTKGQGAQKRLARLKATARRYSLLPPDVGTA